MTKASSSLRSVFGEPDPRLRDKSSSQGQAMAKSLKRALAGLEWVASKHDLVTEMAEVLDLELPDLLVKFWEKSDEIKAALKESKDSPAEITDLGLVDHTIEGTLEPYLELRVGKLPPCKIELTVDLECTLKGVVLRIKNGVIVQILLGSCEVQGTLKHGDLVLATAPREGADPIRFGPVLGTSLDPGRNT